jgi:hypothetical protein
VYQWTALFSKEKKVCLFQSYGNVFASIGIFFPLLTKQINVLGPDWCFLLTTEYSQKQCHDPKWSTAPSRLSADGGPEGQSVHCDSRSARAGRHRPSPRSRFHPGNTRKRPEFTVCVTAVPRSQLLKTPLRGAGGWPHSAPRPPAYLSRRA